MILFTFFWMEIAMKQTFTLILFSIFIFLYTACDATVQDEAPTIISNNTQTLYHDYYSNISSVITSFDDLSIDLSECYETVSESESGICFTNDYIFLYDLIMTEQVGKHTQDGIVGIDQTGEKIRICPEQDCSISDICNHIVLKNGEDIIFHNNFLYICGIPALDTDFYPNTCLMQYNISTHEYTKYAEIPADNVSLFIYSNYLFASATTSDKNAVLYCFDLSQNIGYRYIFHSKSIGPEFLGIAYNHLIAADRENLYFIDGSGTISRILETNAKLIDFDFYNETLFFSLNDFHIYQYDYATNTCESIIDNGYMFDVYNDMIYFLSYETVIGLKVLSPYENENGQIEFEIIDYPLYYGNSIYSYSLNTTQLNTCFTVDNGCFLNGELHVSSFGFIYGCFENNDVSQQSFPSMIVLRDLTSGDEKILAKFWNGGGRSYG